ncbi:MAG TPA: GNAT family N-acetyltransferase [Terriglobales bacterium]
MPSRPLILADLPALHALDQRCFPPGIAYSQAEIAAALRHPQGFHRGAEEGGRLAAFILTQPRGRYGHVITVDVEADFRRQGLGEELMRAAEEHYRGRGASGMLLEAAVNNAGALAFYSRLGYRVERTLPGYYAEDLDGLRLRIEFAGT